MAFSRKLARGFILLIAIGMAAMLVMAVLKGTSRKEHRSEGEGEPSSAEMKISGMEYVEMQEGRKFYVLNASEARYFQDQQKTVLKTVHLTFFMENGEEGYVNSEEGVLYSATKNIELTRAVEAIFPGGYRLLSDKAVYEADKKALLSDTPITVSGPDLQLKGGSWKFLIPERKGFVEGGVQAKVLLKPAKPESRAGR